MSVVFSMHIQATKTNRHRHVRLAAVVGAATTTTTTTTTGNKVDHAINYIAAGTHTPTHLILIYDGSKEQQWKIGSRML